MFQRIRTALYLTGILILCLSLSACADAAFDSSNARNEPPVLSPSDDLSSASLPQNSLGQDFPPMQEPEFYLGIWEYIRAEPEPGSDDWQSLVYIYQFKDDGSAIYCRHYQYGEWQAVYKGTYTVEKTSGGYLLNLYLVRTYLHNGFLPQDDSANAADTRQVSLEFIQEGPSYRARVTLRSGKSLFEGQKLDWPIWFTKVEQSSAGEL